MHEDLFTRGLLGLVWESFREGQGSQSKVAPVAGTHNYVCIRSQRKKDWQSLTCSTRRSHQDSLDRRNLVVPMRCVCVCVCVMCMGVCVCASACNHTVVGSTHWGWFWFSTPYSYSTQGGDDEDVAKFEKQLFR